MNMTHDDGFVRVSAFDADAALSAVWGDQDRFILYGAGVVGQRYAEAILACGRSVSFIWDRQALKIGAVHGIPVIAPEFSPPSCENIKDTPVLICIEDYAASESVSSALREAGYQHIKTYIRNRPAFDIFRFYRCAKKGNTTYKGCLCDCTSAPYCPMRLDYYAKHYSKPTSGQDSCDRLERIIYLYAPFTNICNLRCRGCASASPDPRTPKSKPDVARFVSNIRKIAAAARYIDCIRLEVGEATLFQDELRDALEQVLDIGNIYQVMITTNTTQPLNPAFIRFLNDHNERICFKADDYGLDTRAFNRYTDRLDDCGVPYTISAAKDFSWYDIGIFEYQNVPLDTLRYLKDGGCDVALLEGFGIGMTGWVTAHCCLMETILYCNSAHKDFPGSTFHIDDISPERLADALADLHDNRGYYAVCRYCKRPLKRRIPSAEQM